MIKQTLEEEVNKPNHYRTHESGIEAIEITREMNFDLGNAWKYAMRYEDKNTPKKDIKKLCWYMKDFKEHFIDFNNESTTDITVSADIKSKMLTVINTEPNKIIKTAFEQIYMLVCANGLIFPIAYDKAISDLEAYAETLN